MAAWQQQVGPLTPTPTSAPSEPSHPGGALQNSAAACAVWEGMRETAPLPWSVSPGSGNVFIGGDASTAHPSYTSADLINAANFYLGDLSAYTPVSVWRMNNSLYQDFLVWDNRIAPGPGKALLSLIGLLPLVLRRRRGGFSLAALESSAPASK